MVELYIEALNEWSLRSIMTCCKKHGLLALKTESRKCKVACETPVAITMLIFLKEEYKFGFVQGWTIPVSSIQR